MVLRLLIDAVHPDETRVAIIDNGKISDFDFATAAKKQLKGNIYLAKITRVEPSLQAAFVEYGSGKQGFLPFAEIHPDYYQIPVADRERLLREVAGLDNEPEEAKTENEAELIPQNRYIKPQEEDPEEVFLRAEPELMATLPIHQEQEPEAIFLQAEVKTPDDFIPEIQPEQAPEEKAENEILEPSFEAEHNDHESQDVETLSNEDDVLRESRSGSFYRRYKIQEVIKRNQIVLVQVIKEERGNKGVSLTTYMSLAGRYCVLMPNSPKAGGISRKISSGDDRRRLREISADLKTIGGMSAIIRTAGIDRDRVEIQRDYEYLVKLWSNIREQTLASNAPALIYEEGDIIKRTIRDLYINDIEEIIVAGEEGFKQAHEFLSKILPTGQNTMVKLYQDNVPLFHAYNIEDQLNSMYDPAVKLRSGGYIVINPTEALISIDVNSGRATGERNIEETAVKTNLEAASEVARQLRLRDLAGLIVIDFIDMNDSRNRRSVERAVKDALKQDRAKIQIGRISAFGLLEMSRQRLRPSISESSTVTCTHCHGKGVIRSNSSVALQIIRSLEKEASQFGVAELRLFVTTSCAIVLLNGRRDEISNIEKKYEIKIITIADDSIPHGNFRIEKIKNMRRSNNNVRANEPVSFEQALDENIALAQEGLVAAFDIENAENIKPETGDEPRRNKRNRRNRKPRPQVADAAVLDNENNTAVVEEVVASEDSPKPRDENRPPRPKRAKHWNDRRSKFKENKNSEGSVASENSSSHAETSQPEIKNNNVEAPAASQENAKPKKGWWRRMVEA